jgi:hypothetical protein
MLAVRTPPSGWKFIMSLVFQAVSIVKYSNLNSRIFSELCSEMDASSTELLLHTEVKWLSKGNVLTL